MVNVCGWNDFDRFRNFKKKMKPQTQMEMLQMVGEIQMTKRHWWQLYKKNWYKHTDLWGGLWWIRFKWSKEDETFKKK